jgi:hypothetical protein
MRADILQWIPWTGHVERIGQIIRMYRVLFFYEEESVAFEERGMEGIRVIKWLLKRKIR